MTPMMSVYRKPDKDKCMNSDIYVGVDVHERESQVAVFDKEGGLLGVFYPQIISSPLSNKAGSISASFLIFLPSYITAGVS